MHTAILCEKEVVFIYLKFTDIGLDKMCGTTHVDIVYTEKRPPSRDVSTSLREVWC